jgi:hypothetical protein
MEQTAEHLRKFNCLACQGTGFGFGGKCMKCNGTGEVDEKTFYRFYGTPQEKDFKAQSRRSTSREIELNSNLIIFIIVGIILIIIAFSSPDYGTKNAEANLKSAEQKIDRGQADSLTDDEKRAVNDAINGGNK